jgi:hypothetical protein
MISYTYANTVLQNEQIKEEQVKGSAKTVALLISKPEKVEAQDQFDFNKRYHPNDLLKDVLHMSSTKKPLEKVESENSTAKSNKTGVKRNYTPICYVLEDISPAKMKATVLDPPQVGVVQPIATADLQPSCIYVSDSTGACTQTPAKTPATPMPTSPATAWLPSESVT